MDEKQRDMYAAILQQFIESDIKENEDIPGQFDSTLEGYPGHIRFPAPIMLPHFQKFWETAIKPLADLREIEWEFWNAPLKGVVLLIADFGEWAIEGVQIGEAKEGNMPLLVSEWLTAVIRVYLYPQLDPKKLRAVSTLI